MKHWLINIHVNEDSGPWKLVWVYAKNPEDAQDAAIEYPGADNTCMPDFEGIEMSLEDLNSFEKWEGTK